MFLKYINNKIAWVLCCGIFGLILIYFFWPYDPGRAMVVSVSSNGRYVITSHLNKGIILWDIADKQHSVISKHGNIYSAYFIKNTPYYMWQDLQDVVHISDIRGNAIRQFKFIPTYGQVMTSDLKHYFAADEHWNIYSWDGMQRRIVKRGYDFPSFIGQGKLLNLTLSSSNNLLLSSGSGGYGDDKPLAAGDSTFGDHVLQGNMSRFGGILLWDVKTEKPLHKLPGNQSKSIATFSPNGEIVVCGDESGLAYKWNIKNGKLQFKFANLEGKLIKDHGYRAHWDNTGFVPIPLEFKTDKNFFTDAIIALKFIDRAGYFLRFTTYTPYVILFHVDSQKAIKYIPLDKRPYPCVDDYSRDSAIDTAPKANLLVMAQGIGNGIIVYRYYPNTQTLEKIWAPKI